MSAPNPSSPGSQLLDPATTQRERRRHRRLALGAVAGRVGLAQGLRLLDLSTRGARISTGEALAPGRRYGFLLDALQVAATVTRCALVRLEPDEEGGRPVFEAGVVFDPLSATQRRLLERLAASALARDDRGAAA